jgi:hypothetical protein
LVKLIIKEHIQITKENCNEDCFVLRKNWVDGFELLYAHEGTQVLSYGTIIIYDAKTLETLSIVKFTPFDKMKETREYDDIEKLTQQLNSVSKTARKIESNVAHEGGSGNMYAMG